MLDQEDDLPLQNNGAPSVVGPWNRYDWYLWNRTVRDYFVSKNSNNSAYQHLSLYLFDMSWPLRDPTDIKLISWSVGIQFNTASMISFQIAVYVLVSCSAAACITLAIMNHLPWFPVGWHTFDLARVWTGVLEAFGNCLFGPSRKFDHRRALSFS